MGFGRRKTRVHQKLTERCAQQKLVATFILQIGLTQNMSVMGVKKKTDFVDVRWSSEVLVAAVCHQIAPQNSSHFTSSNAYSGIATIWLFDITMENNPCIDDFPATNLHL